MPDFTELRRIGGQLQEKYKSGKVTVKLPEKITFSFTPTREEKIIAKKLLVFLSDKDVLSPIDCTPEMWVNSFEHVTKSLLAIRDKIVEFDLGLQDEKDVISPFDYLLMYASLGIREFLRETENSKIAYTKALDKVRVHLLFMKDTIQQIVAAKLPLTIEKTKEENIRPPAFVFEVIDEFKIRQCFSTLALGSMFLNETDKTDFINVFTKEYVDKSVMWRDGNMSLHYFINGIIGLCKDDGAKWDRASAIFFRKNKKHFISESLKAPATRGNMKFKKAQRLVKAIREIGGTPPPLLLRLIKEK
ncbi:MAG: hypothetical protein ACLQQ4_12730 [Bacteroidia bacterium]